MSVIKSNSVCMLVWSNVGIQSLQRLYSCTRKQKRGTENDYMGFIFL